MAATLREAILICGFIFSAVLLGTMLFLLLMASYAMLMVLTGHR